MIYPIDFELKKLISVYARKPMKTDIKTDDIGSHYYMETHDIDIRDGKPCIGAGRPFTKEGFDDLQQYFVETKKISLAKDMNNILWGTNPMLYCDQRPGRGRYVWRMPAQRVKLSFTKDSKIPDGDLNCGDLLFMAEGRASLYCFAIDDANNLYDAPFLNLYEDGEVCLGTASLAEVKAAQTFEDYIEAWQSLFWNSRFTAHGIANRDGIQALLRTHINKGIPIPFESLHKRNLTLSQFLKQIEP